MALLRKSEVSMPPGTPSGLPMRERLRIFGIGAGIGLVMVGLYFAGRKQMENLAAAEADAEAAANAANAAGTAGASSNSGPSAAVAPGPMPPAAIPARSETK